MNIKLEESKMLSLASSIQIPITSSLASRWVINLSNGKWIIYRSESLSPQVEELFPSCIRSRSHDVDYSRSLCLRCLHLCVECVYQGQEGCTECKKTSWIEQPEEVSWSTDMILSIFLQSSHSQSASWVLHEFSSSDSKVTSIRIKSFHNQNILGPIRSSSKILSHHTYTQITMIYQCH